MAQLTPEEAAVLATKQAQEAFAKLARPANQIPLPKYFGLHIGRPGSGKTHILGTMPGKTLVIDCRDGGHGTAPLVEHGDRVTVWPVAGWDEFRQAARFCRNGEHDFESVAIDGLSRLQGYNLQAIIENTVRGDGSRPRSMEMDMWGVALDNFTNLVRAFEDVMISRGINVAMTVWEKEQTGKDGTLISMIPNLQGDIKNRIAGMFDVVCYHVTRDMPGEREGMPGPLEFWCLTSPYDVRQEAKCRWRRLLPDGTKKQALEPMEGPSARIDEWLQKIHEGVTQLAAVQNVTVKAEPTQPPVAVAPVQSAAPVAVATVQRAAPVAVASAPKPARAKPEPAVSTAAPPAEMAEPARGDGEAAVSALIEGSKGMPDKEELIAHLRAWHAGIKEHHPDRMLEAEKLLLELNRKHGVARASELPALKLALILEECMQFEQSI